MHHWKFELRVFVQWTFNNIFSQNLVCCALIDLTNYYIPCFLFTFGSLIFKFSTIISLVFILGIKVNLFFLYSFNIFSLYSEQSLSETISDSSDWKLWPILFQETLILLVSSYSKKAEIFLVTSNSEWRNIALLLVSNYINYIFFWNNKYLVYIIFAQLTATRIFSISINLAKIAFTYKFVFS